MHSVFLDGTENMVTISDSAFALIEELIVQNKVCRACQKPYNQDRPEVVRNGCLVCFLTTYEDKRFSFLGTQEGKEQQFRFIDFKGYIYITSTSVLGHPQPNIPETLTHWGFSVPEQVTIKSQVISLKTGRWSLHGDIQHNSAIVVEYIEFQKRIPFLALNTGGCVFLDKKRGKTRSLYRQARTEALMRSTFEDERGKEYRIYKGERFNALDDALYYFFISDIVSREHKTKLDERS